MPPWKCHATNGHYVIVHVFFYGRAAAMLVTHGKAHKVFGEAREFEVWQQ